MKAIIAAQLAAFLTLAAGAASAQGGAPAAPEPPAPAAKAASARPIALKGEIAVGEIFTIKLPCNPTTGYGWEIKSIDRRVAVSTGTADFEPAPAEPGAVGAGGLCVLRVLGVKPGKTKAVLSYRRPWESNAPAKTASAAITVVPKKP